MLRWVLHRFGAMGGILLIAGISVSVSLMVTAAATYLYHREEHLVYALKVATICPLLVAVPVSYVYIRLLQKLDKRERALVESNEKLQSALSEVKELSGMLPICASCKKIRDDKGYWNQIESYIRDHTRAEFSHGICPDCAKELYSELYAKTPKP